ncbi:MAG: YkvA family protein [Advenella sp.]|uniref:YkvA family protein n=1 Tax=Advenella sp. S44 TaxID=1982755 RepID=UPI000C2ABC2B|nr:DUF1232 domain-containing protein [Advenella sp. S44]
MTRYQTIDANRQDAGKPAGLVRKIARVANRAGRTVIHKALLLYYAVLNPATPAWARRVIYGALAYLVLPLDALPDFIPGIGYTDDLSVIAAALAAVAYYITPEVKQQAEQATNRWFKH